MDGRGTPTLDAGAAHDPSRQGTSGAVRRGPRAWQAVALGAGIALVLFAVAGFSLANLPFDPDQSRTNLFPGRPWLEAWIQWDAGWYKEIARNGYWFADGRQSPVAFFPAYGLLMRAGDRLLGNDFLAGILITLTAGLAVAGLYATWLRDRLSPAGAWTALLVLLLFPYSYYLYGAVYADALLLASILGAFLLVERDRPLLAGLVGAVATAARPVGAVLIVGLVLRTVERRGGWRAVGWRDLGVLTAGLGIGAYCLYLWVRFGDPLLFLEAQEAWGQEAGWQTWLKLQFFEDVRDFRNPFSWLAFVAHPVITVLALALVPRVFRRFGYGYGAYAVLVLGVPALATQNFFGMARYTLAAFPCFAVVGEWLADRPRLRTPALVASGLGLVVFTSFYSRGYYLS